MADFKLRKYLSSSFKLHGYTLRSDSCTFLVEQFAPLPESEQGKWLNKLVDHIQNQRLPSAVIERNAVELAVKDCANEHHAVADDLLTVFNAFDLQEFAYNLDLKKYEPVTSRTPKIYDDASAKARMFCNRYWMLKQLTERHHLFKQTSALDDRMEKYRIQPIEHLLSSSKRLNGVITMGIFSQLKVDCYHLEDPTGIVQLDLSQTVYDVGLPGENCVVLAEGWYEDKLFHANAIGFPPAETSTTSRAYLGNTSMFGGDPKFNCKTSVTLKKALYDTKDRIIVFLSDVWLDQDQVMRKLNSLFQGYSAYPPIAFVFMGNFLSARQGSSNITHLKAHFKTLGDMIASFPDLVQQSRFIFVPGPSDPSCASVLPRPPIPHYIWSDFERRVPGVIFTSNPCHIRYCTEEIVVLRENVMTKLCHNTVHYPSSGSIYEHFGKTLTSQAHLLPLPLHICPVYWAFEHTLRLHPLPDLVVVGDMLSTFSVSHAECQIANPGPFSKNNFAFIAYCPATKEVEESQIEDV